MRNLFALVFVGLFVQTSGYAQSEAEEVTRLKRENEMLRRDAWANQMKAVAAEKNAERLRYQAISIAMGNRSKVVQDKQLAGLVALQAYRFNKSHGGYDYDNAVFTGLVKALNRFSYEHKSLGEFPPSQLKEVAEFTVDISDPDGKILIKRKDGSIFYLWGHLAKVKHFVLYSSGKVMATVDAYGLVLIWNLLDQSKEPLSIRLNKDRAVQNIEFSTDSAELRVTFSNSEQQVWSLDSNLLASILEDFLTRNLSHVEWQIYVAPDLPYEKTVARLPEGLFDK